MSRKFATNESVLFTGTGEEGEVSVSQKALSLISLRFLMALSIVLLGFFAVSSVRVIVLTIAKSGRANRARYSARVDLAPSPSKINDPTEEIGALASTMPSVFCSA